MTYRDVDLNSACQHLLGQYYEKLFCVDLTDDTYQVYIPEGHTWMCVNDEGYSGKISELIERFQASGLSYPADKDVIGQFADVRTIRTRFEEHGMRPLQLFYKRKTAIGDTAYRSMKLDMIPAQNSDGHLIINVFSGPVVNDTDYQNRKFDIIGHNGADANDGRCKVLVVEDDELNRELLCALLEDEYDVIEAENGQEGIDILRKRFSEIAIVLLDVQMPVMDGYGFLRNAKADPMLASIPVIVTTASDSQEEELRCLDVGATDFVKKPYNGPIIKSRLQKIIRLRESMALISAIEYDELTGLYTRQAFYQHAEKLLKREPDTSFTLIISDFEGFRFVNERYGEKVGDQILRYGGAYLKRGLDDRHLVGRYSGDQFVTLVPFDPIYCSAEGLEQASRLCTGNGSLPNLVMKFGVYDNIDHNMPISRSCDRALMALRTVKHVYGKTYAAFDAAMERQIEVQARIESVMQDALREGQFQVYYQPKHDAVTGRLAGAEALIRWVHPEYGFMSPADFVPLFETNGFITEVDAFVWHKTCENQRRWLDAGLAVVPISINGSRLDFQRKGLAEQLEVEADAAGLDHSLLYIEVTETLCTEHMDELAAALHRCRDKGFAVELDDFGSGYSSLNTLASLPIDVIKLDRALLGRLDDAGKKRVLAACLSLAKSLGLQTVSEGVETEEQYAMLKDLGADMIQGYYFSRPLSEAEFEAYLRQNAQ